MSAPSLGKGGDDGAIDILLVGMDSRTDAHGNPLSARGAGDAARPATRKPPTPTRSS